MVLVFLVNSSLVWLSIFLIGIVIACVIILIFKYVPAFKHKNSDKSPQENAMEDVQTIVRDDRDIIEEKKLTMEKRMRTISAKAEEMEVELTDDDYFFLVIQEEINEIDKTFYKGRK